MRYGALVLIAEELTVIQPWPGALATVAVMAVLLWGAATAESEDERRLVAALTILPLIRLVSLTLPMSRLSVLLWIGVVTILIATAALIVVRRLRIPRREIGVSSRNLIVQFPLAGIGLGVGVIAFLILPRDLLPIPAGSEPIAAATIVGAAAITQEVLFRGLILMLAVPLLGPLASVLFAAFLATSLEVGYGSIVNIAFTLVASIIYGYLVWRTGSIVGMALAHALASISLLVLLPAFEGHVTGLFALSTVMSLLGAASLQFVRHPPAAGQRSAMSVSDLQR